MLLKVGAQQEGGHTTLSLRPSIVQQPALEPTEAPIDISESEGSDQGKLSDFSIFSPFESS